MQIARNFYHFTTTGETQTSNRTFGEIILVVLIVYTLFVEGPGRLNNTGGSYDLDTGRMEVGYTYEIMVIITKDSRQGTASFLLTVLESADIPEPVIT